MSNGFWQVGVELSECELALIQGGNIFEDAWNGIEKGVKAVYDWAKSDGGKTVLGGAAALIPPASPAGMETHRLAASTQ